ncbi:MAG: prepilin-type N-terminal cleavage/methylation domain-containing protein [Verrucomicrobia bacterium]|nr:prepilin-type N-terminal cleavage/methylation domain-containing protein [Verrucomicrobiota bacterium]
MRKKFESREPGAGSQTRRSPRSAFTLIELMAVIGIMGLMMMVAIPAMRNFGSANQISNAGRQVYNAMTAARQYALRENAHVRVVVAYEETVEGNGVPDHWKWVNCSAYAIMRQPSLSATALFVGARGGSQYTARSPAQPNTRYGDRWWEYIQPWRPLPKGVVFDPSTQEVRAADNRTILPPSTIFSDSLGNRATPTFQHGATRDQMPFPDDLGKTPTWVAVIEFNPSGTPVVGGSVRLVNGLIEPDGKLVVQGRQNPTSAQGSTDPAAKNCVVLQWDDMAGKIRWIQPGR